ncbi:MAG: nitroreductase family protein [Actinomycetota bacterium]
MDHEAFALLLAKRHMVRSFSSEALAPDLVGNLITGALSAPTAGNSRGVEALVLSGPATERYWAISTDASWRAQSRRFAGMARAPIIVLFICKPSIYTDRYAESDKAKSGLSNPEAWPVPYWFGDAAFATMALLLGASSADLGASFLGSFRNEEAILQAFGKTGDWHIFGAVLLGKADGKDHKSESLKRSVPSASEQITWIDR